MRFKCEPGAEVSGIAEETLRFDANGNLDIKDPELAAKLAAQLTPDHPIKIVKTKG